MLQPARKASINAIIRREQEARDWPVEDWSGKTAEGLAEIFGTSAQLWAGLGANCKIQFAVLASNCSKV